MPTYTFTPPHPPLSSRGEFPCLNTSPHPCPIKFYVETPLLIQNTRTRSTLPATISQPTTILLLGQCYACQQRICLLCLHPAHSAAEMCTLGRVCPVALEKFSEA
ncbi:hypothetical protein L873DRAFT_1809250 [Choiromyces venosus 120613-1]|uniref:Uncharacterized protein n=1 Tax=Choiromyces venosus 120613-1 TaxID=1336337 RepID=A0A3N4JMY7_9PEZI|nr:hypothetical protein L873DRAFT_1809250 [Choiromyces venosus 120613-1]